MKDFFVRWTARGRIVTFVVVLCALAGGSGSAWAGGGKTAQVAVGFTGVIMSDIAPPSNFQNVLLNVQAVRINPHANAGPSSGGWQTIPTPPGIGGGSQSAELQIDLNTSQDVPELFNTTKVRPATYKSVELLLDPNRPATLIPNCPQSGVLEGCITYPIALTNGQVIIAPVSGLQPSNGTVAQLILQTTIMINQAPTVAGGAYQATLSINPVTTGLGKVTGSITHPPGGTSGATGKLIKLGVTAETIGTNTAIGTALIKGNQYTLLLPAANGFGTLYDLAVAGGGDSYSATRLPPLFPGATINGPTFNVMGQMVGNITGSVMDGCVAGTPIVGATLQLLVPPVSSSNANLDCTMNPDQCVTVASATTDNAGNFPLPGSLTTPPEFQNVPAPPSSNPNSAYAMEVTAPGYDPLMVQVKPSTGAGKNSGGVCAPPGSSTFTKCNLLMSTAFITGTIPITPPLPGQTTLVQVFAEPTGSNNIVSALPMPISNRNPNKAVNFTIRVPSLVVPGFDLFATTIDQYQGISDPYQGHNIAVFSGAPQPGHCNTSMPVEFAQTINCVGHGSIVGNVGHANLGASIALSKLSSPDGMSGAPVAITTAQIQDQTSGTSNFAFCVPGDTYQLQALQLPQPIADEAPSVAPTPVPTGDSTVVTIMTPNPSATPTPKLTCPTTCSNPDGSCPGICNTTNVGTLNIPTLPPTPGPTMTPTATPTM